nr:HAD domain-containing protein [uncultured Flavobacterium sp.]
MFNSQIDNFQPEQEPISEPTAEANNVTPHLHKTPCCMPSIVFLDIDGVLNCQTFYMANPPETRGSYPLSEICKERVQWLNELCKDVNAKVVISSTWRIGKTVEQLEAIFNEVGATFEIIDKTPSYHFKGSVRGNEIKAWLEENCKKLFDCYDRDFKRYVIIDDDSDMLLWQRNHFFQTDNYSGLTPNICYKIKMFLQGQSIRVSA